MGREFSSSSQVKPHSAGGGRPRTRRCVSTSSHCTPQRLGARPSTEGQELSDDNGLPPNQEKAWRRVGNSGPEVQASAAWSCDTAAAQDLWERPQGGRPCRVPSARKHECLNEVDVHDPGDGPAQQGQDTLRRETTCGSRQLASGTDWSTASSSPTTQPSLGTPPAHGNPALHQGERAPRQAVSDTSATNSGDGGRPAARGIDSTALDRHRPSRPNGATLNSAQHDADADRGLTMEDVSGSPAYDAGSSAAHVPPPPAHYEEQARRGNEQSCGDDGAGNDGGWRSRVRGMQTSPSRDSDERPREPQGLQALQRDWDRGHGDHLEHRGPREGRAGCDHGLEHHATLRGHAEPARGRHHHLDGPRLDEDARVQPQRQCGDSEGSAGRGAQVSPVESRGSVWLTQVRSTSVASGSWEGPGRGPLQHASTSSFPASSRRGTSKARPTSSACSAGHGAAATALHGAATGDDTLGSQSAQASACAGPPVPVWMRTPSWLYLPHLVPPATVMHVQDGDGRQDEVGVAEGMHTARIRGRDTSPGTRRLTPLERAREKLAARNAHLARSFNDHAERVEKRKAQGRSPTGIATAAERIAAIRRRLAARQAAEGMVTDLRDPVAAAGGGGRPMVEGEMSSTSAGSHELSGGHGTDAGRPRGQPQDAVHDREPRSHRRTDYADSQPPAEEEETPETGAWSTEDPKIHYAPLHANRIQMPSACTSRGGRNSTGDTSRHADAAGNGAQHRSREEVGRQRGDAAPPDAASEAAASRVAWHTAAGSGRTGR